MADEVVREQVVTTDSAVVRPYSLSQRIVNIIFGFFESLLAIRVILSLLGANPENAFAGLIYNVTYPLAAPFFGLFGYTVQYGVSRFEIETVVAMVVYALLGYGIVRLLALFQTRN